MKMMSVSRVVPLLVIGTLAACTTVTKPVPMGDERYLITMNAHGGLHGDGELLQQTIMNANQFCSDKGMHAEVLSTQNSGTQMWTPQNNQVVFRCDDRKSTR